MNTCSRLWVVLGLVLAVAAGCGDGDSIKEACDKACATAGTLNCPKDNKATCASECEQVPNALAQCKSQLEAVIKCSAERPASDWQCDMDGESEIKDGVCETEGQAAALCILGGAGS